VANCDVPNCEVESAGSVDNSGTLLALCEWHLYEYNNDLGWIGKDDEDAVKYTFPKIERPNDLKETPKD